MLALPSGGFAKLGLSDLAKKVPGPCPHGKMLLALDDASDPLGFILMGGCCWVSVVPKSPGLCPDGRMLLGLSDAIRAMVWSPLETQLCRWCDEHKELFGVLYLLLIRVLPTCPVS